ncbi:MAG: glycosyltransferase 87 family protein [Thermoanaerobaculia bacterium]
MDAATVSSESEGVSVISTPVWVAALALGLALRIALIATSIGSNDVVFKTMWRNIIDKHGVAGAYAWNKTLNDRELGIALFPPLSLLIMKGESAAARLTGLEYTDIFRGVQVVADIVGAFALFVIARRMKLDARAVTLFFFLSPAVIFVSAFHCNTDSTMVALTLVAAMLLTLDRKQEFWSGVALACAVGIKVVPLFLVPFFVVAVWPRVWRWVAGFALGFVAVFLPAAVTGGYLALNNLLGYAGYAGKWGVAGLLLTLESFIARRATTVLYNAAYIYATIGKYLVIAAVGAFAFWLWTRVRREPLDSRGVLLASIPVAYLIVLFLAPGFGVQYLLWPIPLLPFVFRWRFALVVSLAISAYLFVAYTIWSEGFPWWYADSIKDTPFKIWVTYLGFPVWLLVGVAALVGIRRLRDELIPRPQL